MIILAASFYDLHPFVQVVALVLGFLGTVIAMVILANK